MRGEGVEANRMGSGRGITVPITPYLPPQRLIRRRRAIAKEVGPTFNQKGKRRKYDLPVTRPKRKCRMVKPEN